MAKQAMKLYEWLIDWGSVVVMAPNLKEARKLAMAERPDQTRLATAKPSLISRKPYAIFHNG